MGLCSNVATINLGVGVMRSIKKLRGLVRESAQSERKRALEAAFHDALVARDVALAAVVAAQLRQYVSGVRHA